jgi:DNA replication and repair protein RecF
MSLSRLEILSVRNIELAKMQLHRGVNGVYGENGSGKSSLLESIYLLGTFRSFRTQHLGSVINDQAAYALVRGQLSDGGSLAVQKDRRGQRHIRIDNQVVKASSQLAEVLPVLVFDPDTINLVLGQPGYRRRFLNWGVFHVKHQFSQLWKEVNRCLQQRNALLKRSSVSETLSQWTTSLVEKSENLDGLRRDYSNRLKQTFLPLARGLCDVSDLELEYYRGWNESLDLLVAYEQDLHSDLKRGFTQKGFHRAEIRVTVKGKPVAEVCSRGEAKMLSWALALSQLELLPEQARKNLILLVDDLASEIDPDHRKAITALLCRGNHQIFTTSTDKETLIESWGGHLGKMFHVKQGIISTIGEDIYD